MHPIAKDKKGKRLYYDDYIQHTNGQVYLITEIKPTSIKAKLCSRKDRYEYTINLSDLKEDFILL